MCSPWVLAMPPRWRRQLLEHVLALGPDTLRVVRALIGGAVPAELAGVREQFRATIGQRWSPWFRTLGFDDQSSDALVWVMTAAYLSLAESVDDGEIGADRAASIIAMLADGIVNQAAPSACGDPGRNRQQRVPQPDRLIGSHISSQRRATRNDRRCSSQNRHQPARRSLRRGARCLFRRRAIHCTRLRHPAAQRLPPGTLGDPCPRSHCRGARCSHRQAQWASVLGAGRSRIEGRAD